MADIDWIAPIIFRVREMGENPDMVIDCKFQNVPFVLNILDSLAGDDRFVDLRKRTRPHRILTKIEEATEEYRKTSLDEQTKFMNEAQQADRSGRAGISTRRSPSWKTARTSTRACCMQMLERERIQLERMRDVQDQPRWRRIATSR